MSDSEAPAGAEAVQFDRVVSESGSAAAPDTPAVVCAGCKLSLHTMYYDVNGSTLCGTCRAAVESAAETPRGLGPLLMAAGFGAGAGLAGAAIYYAVIAIANLEIGIVAILIGYMVGYSVRRGARGRGGLRFQVLAAVLTYGSVALAYAPLAFQQAFEEKPASQTATVPSTPASTTNATPEVPEAPAPASAKRSPLLALVLFLGVIAALPVLVVIGSMPSGLISALIIFFGMRQAWKMTSVPLLQISGPYRVGASQPAAAS